MSGVNDMRCPIVLLETLFDKGEQDSVLLVLAVEKRADMPSAIENRTRQPDVFVIPHFDFRVFFRRLQEGQVRRTKSPSMSSIRSQTCDDAFNRILIVERRVRCLRLRDGGCSWANNGTQRSNPPCNEFQSNNLPFD